MQSRSDKIRRCSGESRSRAGRRLVAGAVLLAALLGGCSDLYYDRRETVTFAANDATATAQAVQVIDPWPAAAYNRNIAYNGPRVAGAVERYRTGKIIPPSASPTSSGFTINMPSGQGGGAANSAGAASAAP